MDLHSKFPYWLMKNGLLQSYPPLQSDDQCEVVVVGGGITGALVANAILSAGLSVIVLDCREIAQGSTSASTALLQYEIDTHLVDLSRMIGEENGVRAYQLCLNAIDRLGETVSSWDDDCGFEYQPSLYFASSSKDLKRLKAEYELRARHGFPVRWCSAGEIQDEFGFEALGGILSSKAAVIDPFQFTHRYLKEGQSRGLRIFDRTSVTDIEHQDGLIVLKTNRDYSVRARKIVFACGYEAQGYLREKIVTLKSTYALVTGPDQPQAWKQPGMIWESARPYLYLRRTRDGRILAGGEDDPFRSPALRDARLPAKEQRLIDRLKTLFPDHEWESEYSWAGTFGETKDGLGYIGASPEMENTFFALGFGGNGITFSVVAAEILHDLVHGKPNADAGLFRFQR